MRDRAEREREILQAMGRIFIRDGYSAIGINSIANEAGCNKVLIYRYFTDINGLYRAFAKEINIFDFEQLHEVTELPIVDQVIGIFIKQLETLRSNPLLQEVMKFELVDTNDLTRTLAEQREESGKRYLVQYRTLTEKSDVDIAAVTALISAGITYMVLRSGAVSEFNGIPVQSEDGWKRVEDAVSYLIRLLFHDINKGDINA